MTNSTSRTATKKCNKEKYASTDTNVLAVLDEFEEYLVLTARGRGKGKPSLEILRCGAC
ncbi:hypothetical protein M407DRAFT_97126 [Tulasnella calospora MUT 4182]|uniref:Uncharacterized protein n=1 Tax=Tulasnella calospora MUT 4182 TaxID=1051891 RepID=A0A0C3QH29_9AGAM|nr:hypothetical protein M407DRAFT_97126 [Tulasnella calospora MUT 4182]